MTYTDINFKTLKALKEALKEGKEVTVYQPGPFAYSIPKEGVVTLEGPHYPEPHRWYARAEIKDGKIVRLLK